MHEALRRAMAVPSHKSLRLLLVRHGEVDARWRGTIYGRLDVPLSERGHRQSQLVADALRSEDLEAVVSSGLQRAEAAAALIRAGRGSIQRQDEPRLTELDRGRWAGRLIDDLAREAPAEMERWRAARGAIQAPGGEDPGDLALRTHAVFDELAARHAGGTVVVVAHLWVVRSALTACLGLPMSASARLGLPPGGICEVSWPERGAAPARGPRLQRLGV